MSGPRPTLLALIVESSNDAIMSTNLEGIVESWNPAAERMYGYPANEIIGRSFFRLIAPENLTEVRKIVQKVLKAQTVEPYETIQIKKDGSALSLLITVSSIHDQNGEIVGASAIARDMTDMKQALQNSRNMISIIEFSNDAITSVDVDGIVTSWNSGAERMYGYLATEMIGHSVSRILPSGNPFELAYNQAKIREGDRVEPYQTLRIRKDGSSIAISLTLSPLYDKKGVVVGTSGIARDITQEKQAAQHARHMAGIIDSSNKSVISTNADRIITSWNLASERLFSYSAQEMVGQPIARIIPLEKIQETISCFEKTMANIRIEPFKTLRIRKDGSTVLISLTISPIFDPHGVVIGVSNMAQDITQEEAAAHNFREMARLVETSNDAITSRTLEGFFTIWNSAAERIYGYSAEEMIGQPISRIMSPQEILQDSKNLSRIRAGYKIEPYETIRIKKDGSSIAISLTLSPLYGNNGVVIGVSAIGRDVTKEKEAAQHARNMASIIKYSNDSITSVDLDGIITSVNPAAERLYGYMAEEMIGQPTSRFTSQENIHEIANILRNIEAGDQIKPYETLRFSKDGRPIPISMTISPMYNEKGEIIARSSISRDISVEKEAAQYARNLAAIIISSNDAIATGDTDMNFTSWNSAAERMFGYSAAEMIGQSFSRLSAPETIHEDHENCKNLLAGKTVEPYETVRLTKAGNPIPIFLTVSAIHDENGVLIGFSSIARNLTQEQQVISQLQELNELRNEFVSTVAHDLRAPMASISGFAHLLIDEWSATADEKKIEYLRIITRNTDGLADFVEDVLQVARIEAGEYTYNVQPFDLGVLVQRALSEAIGPHSARSFELKSPDELPLVLGDEARLWQVLTNLLSNAIKFSPVLAPIVIELANVGDLVQVAVKDGGIGIAKEDLSKLFRKSGRLIKSGHPTISGNGLGLFICKTLVEAQGGELWCESIPGKSSTFFFTIPVAR